MAKYIIDVNLPYYFALWSDKNYVYVKDINDEWSDIEIWQYAKQNNLTIVTKDSDFSDMIFLYEPPPHIIHIKIGNMKMSEFYEIINRVWDEVCKLSRDNKLVRVFTDRIECIN